MRLRDLDAQFLCDVSARSQTRMEGDSADGAVGILFQCPSCGAGKPRGEEDGRGYIIGARSIRVLFANPQNATVVPIPLDEHDTTRWSIVSGSTVDDLTLAPSINCDVPDKKTGEPSSCKFHGFIRNGDVA